MLHQKVFATLAPHGVPDEAGRLEGTAGADILGGFMGAIVLNQLYKRGGLCDSGTSLPFF